MYLVNKLTKNQLIGVNIQLNVTFIHDFLVKQAKQKKHLRHAAKIE